MSKLTGTALTNPTSLQFGPDGRLYVSQQDGVIHVYSIKRNAANYYQVEDVEIIDNINSILNHNDDGSLNPGVTNRQVTGILVKGASTNPIIYVTSSDPRNNERILKAGVKTGLDTNSGMVSRLEWNGAEWIKTDLVRGLPRSDEVHATNGMQLDEVNNVLYVAQGGHTNVGAPGYLLAYSPEYALSACILAVDLTVIGNKTYDLPTLDDEDRSNVLDQVNGYEDSNDPFGGNSGKNMAMWKVGEPVQVYARGFRNPYDVLLTQSGQLYTIDNGPNWGYGGVPVNCSNEPNEKTAPLRRESLFFIPGPNRYYGHANPVRGNYHIHFNNSNPQHAVDSVLINPNECTYNPTPDIMASFEGSTNGLTQYTASNIGGTLKGDLIAAYLGSGTDGKLFRIKLNATGDSLAPNGFQLIASNFGCGALDVTAQGDSSIYPGTIWVANYCSHDISILEPSDFSGKAVSCNAKPSRHLDSDQDGYNNADEIANGTGLCNAADKPSDFDLDLLSDLFDPDDDGDGIPDTLDYFAMDAHNGTKTSIPHRLDFRNVNAGGIEGWGFTGMMCNGMDNYRDYYSKTLMTVGAAAKKFVIDEVHPGDAYHDLNSQHYAFQFGLHTSEEELFIVHCRVLIPFAGIAPQNYQSCGMYIGTGDQSDYLKLVVSGLGGSGGFQIVYEENDGGYNGQKYPSTYNFQVADVIRAKTVDIFLRVDGTSHKVQPYYSINGADRKPLGSELVIPASWTNKVMAVGIISTSRDADPFVAVWDFIDVSKNKP